MPPSESGSIFFGSTAPFGIDQVTRACSECRQFLGSLPASVGRWEKQLGEQDPGFKLFDFAESSTLTTYVDSNSGERFVMALALASEIPLGRTLHEALTAVTDAAEATVRYSPLGMSNEGATHPFAAYQQFANEAIGDVMYLHWGHKDSHCLFTTSARTPEDLEALTLGIVNTIRASNSMCRP